MRHVVDVAMYEGRGNRVGKEADDGAWGWWGWGSTTVG